MKAQRLVGRGKTLLVALVTAFILMVLLVGTLAYMLRPIHLDAETRRTEAAQLVAKVGGASKVCEEASQIFRRFGVAHPYVLEESEEKDYPAIAALAHAGWRGIEIELYSPALIQIAVGNHQRNYGILIFDSDGEKSYFARDAMRIENSCIFVP